MDIVHTYRGDLVIDLVAPDGTAYRLKNSSSSDSAAETDCQTPLNEYLAGFIREKNFITEARAWNNYKDYRPMIELAKANHIPVTAANAPARYTNMANRLGLNSLQQLDLTGKPFCPRCPSIQPQANTTTSLLR